jgi:hypothetical protein
MHSENRHCAAERNTRLETGHTTHTRLGVSSLGCVFCFNQHSWNPKNTADHQAGGEHPLRHQGPAKASEIMGRGNGETEILLAKPVPTLAEFRRVDQKKHTLHSIVRIVIFSFTLPKGSGQTDGGGWRTWRKPLVLRDLHWGLNDFR